MSLMMMKTNPITPPPELVDKLFMLDTSEEGRLIAAYRAGADQELRACCDTLQRHAHWDLAVFELMDDRRPKPPSLKEQALKVLESAPLNADEHALIRRALEALDD
jgi:hypothetical protein